MTSAANKKGTAKPLPTPEAIVFDCYDTLFRNPQSGWQAVVGEIAVDQNLPVDADDLYRTWKTLEVQFRGRRVNMVDSAAGPSIHVVRAGLGRLLRRDVPLDGSGR